MHLFIITHCTEIDLLRSRSSRFILLRILNKYTKNFLRVKCLILREQQRERENKELAQINGNDADAII